MTRDQVIQTVEIGVAKAYVEIYNKLKEEHDDFHDFAHDYWAEQAGNGGEVPSSAWDYEDEDNYQDVVDSYIEEVI